MTISTAATHHLRIVKGATFKKTIRLSDKASATIHTIVGVNTGTATWTIRGDQRAYFTAGKLLLVEGNAADANGRYVVSSSALDVNSDTAIIVTRAIDSQATIRGTIRRETNSPFNLTDYTITARIEDTAGTLLVAPTCTVTSAVNGEFEMTMSAAITGALADWTTAVYDVKFVTGSEVYYWIQGEVTLETPIT